MRRPQLPAPGEDATKYYLQLDFSVYDWLPDEFTIYRGCGPLNKGGFSWSLDRDVAAWFPF